MATRRGLTSRTKSKLKMKSYTLPIRQPVTADEARAALLKMVGSIPASQLGNFRGGQVLIVK